MTCYQKRTPLWTVIASVLLVLFVLPSAAGGGQRENRLEGHLGRERI